MKDKIQYPTDTQLTLSESTKPSKDTRTPEEVKLNLKNLNKEIKNIEETIKKFEAVEKELDE